MGAWRAVQAEPSSEAPPGRGGAGCVAIGGRRILYYGGADRTPTAYDDWWLLELPESGGAHWTRVSPVVKLSSKRKLLPRSGASLTYIPAADGSGEGRVYIFGGQEPVAGVIFDDLLCLETASWELTDVPPPRPQTATQQQQQQQQSAAAAAAAAGPAVQGHGQGQPKQRAQQQARQQGQRQARPPGRHSHVAGMYEGQGLVIYGGAGLRGPLADVWVWQPGEADDAALGGADAGAGVGAGVDAAGPGGGGGLPGPGGGAGGGPASSLTSPGWQCLSEGLAEEECPEAREMAAGVMISDAGLLVHGGRGADGALLDDISIFDGRAGRWVLQQQTGFPRCAHTACNATATASAAASGASAEGSVATAGAAAVAGAGGKQGATAAAGGGGGASNVLLYGGFTGETVAGDLLQLTFLRQQRSSGAHGLRAELRPVKAATEAAPSPRFAHGAAVLSGPGAAEVVVVGGVNQTDDLADVHVWTV